MSIYDATEPCNSNSMDKAAAALVIRSFKKFDKRVNRHNRYQIGLDDRGAASLDFLKGGKNSQELHLV